MQLKQKSFESNLFVKFKMNEKQKNMNPKITMGLRILFGLFCLIFGINKFANFMPFPPIPGDGGVLMGIYVSSGFLKIIGVIEIIGGLLLLVGKFVPLALTFLIAIMFNAVIFHVLHDMANIPGALVGLILGLVLVVAYKDRFSSLLSA